MFTFQKGVPMERRRSFGFGLILILTLAFSNSLKAFDATYARWDDVLTKYSTPEGNVKYKALKADLTTPNHPFALFIDEITKVKKAEFDAWPKDAQIAFLLNAYNALAIKLVLQHYPVKSIKDIGGLFTSAFSTKFFSLLDGEMHTLDSISEDRLKEKYGDPRTNFAICATAKSSPMLGATAFRAESLDAQLDEAMTIFLSDRRRNRFEGKSGSLYLSKIFEWAEDQLDTKYGGMLKAVEKFGPEEARVAISKGAKFKYNRFDWNLNDAATERPRPVALKEKSAVSPPPQPPAPQPAESETPPPDNGGPAPSPASIDLEPSPSALPSPSPAPSPSFSPSPSPSPSFSPRPSPSLPHPSPMPSPRPSHRPSPMPKPSPVKH